LIILAEHILGYSSGASNNSSIVYVRAKKKERMKKNKTQLMDLSSSNSSPDGKVEVSNDPVEAIITDVTMQEVKSQDLPKMADFGEFNKAKSHEVVIEEDESSKTMGGNISNLSKNLLEDNDNE
jgi:hypothetical protein